MNHGMGVTVRRSGNGFGKLKVVGGQFTWDRMVDRVESEID